MNIILHTIKPRTIFSFILLLLSDQALFISIMILMGTNDKPNYYDSSIFLKLNFIDAI
jgi:hypothetical protein